MGRAGRAGRGHAAADRRQPEILERLTRAEAMKKAIGDNMIPKGWTVEQGLALIKKSGFEGVELWLGDKPWFQMNTSDAEVRALRRKVEDVGLAVSDVANTFDWDENISARDPQVR